MQFIFGPFDHLASRGQENLAPLDQIKSSLISSGPIDHQAELRKLSDEEMTRLNRLGNCVFHRCELCLIVLNT